MLLMYIVPWLVLWPFTLFATTKSSMGTQLDATLVTPNDITEVLSDVFHCPLQPFLLVYISNQLTVGTASEGPSKGCSIP